MSEALEMVGLLCNCSLDGDPISELSPSLVNRVFLIDRRLREQGAALFLYSPRHVSSADDISGYLVAGDALVRAQGSLPRVNANWTYGTRKLINQGMGYKKFKRWMKDNGGQVFVPYAFSELVSNKLKTYNAVREYDANLHPHTEDFVSAVPQIEAFLERSRLVFIKPRAGNKGNEIFVLRREGAGIALKYYDQGGQRLLSPITLEAALGVVAIAADDKSYIVQEGIESVVYNGSVFDVRVCMVNDGDGWHALLETRVAPENSDLSNVFQGGAIEETRELLAGLFGASEAMRLEEEITRVSHGVAESLEEAFPGDLMEIGFDFVLSQDRRLHLVEVNAKPGVAGFGSETKLFEWKPEDEHYYRKWVYPHVDALAHFLAGKAASAVHAKQAAPSET
ncbi:MAG: glutathione synthase/RimK-type ligase-like ATP-grasp enzyme [Myxococcota bacterium]